MDREILKKSAVVLRKGAQVRYAFIARQRAHYPLNVLCRVLSVSVSGFHAFLHRSSRTPDAEEARLREDLRTIHKQSSGPNGLPRMVHAIHCSRATVRPVL